MSVGNNRRSRTSIDPLASHSYPSPPSNSNGTIMPHPQSPDRLPSEDASGLHGAVQPFKGTFCASIPLHPQVPLPSVSPRTSVTASIMTASLQDYAPAKEQSLNFMDPNTNDPHAMHWPTHNDLHINRTSQNRSSYHSFQYAPDYAAFYGYGHGILPYDGDFNFAYAASLSSACPRTYANGINLTGLPMTTPESYESYPPAAYQIEPQRPYESADLADRAINSQLMQLREEFDPSSPIIKQEAYTSTDYSSPYDSDVSRSSNPADDPPMPPHNYGPNGKKHGAFDKEQPYAQLIFQALKDAPRHTMILRDIYDWFVNNTDKALDKETKGWQNSIRHNLSMNGAFEKVDQPGDDAKRGFMWRLTPEAIRDGVKSTTRYRSKQPNKRGQRSHPLPQRQVSGYKGGRASRRAGISTRRGHTRGVDAYRSDPVRSVPAMYDPYAVDIPMPYSPYYGSPAQSEHEYMDEDYGNTMGGMPNMELFNNRSYPSTPVSQQSTASGDSAFIELPLNPLDPLFTNSPSPSADEPRTPDPHTADWLSDVAMEGPEAGVTWDMGYSKFPV